MGRSPVAEAKCTGAQLAGPYSAGVASLNLLFFHRVSLDLTEAFLWKVLQGAGQFSKPLHPVAATTFKRSHMEREGRGCIFFSSSPVGPSSTSNFAVHYLLELRQKDQRTKKGPKRGVFGKLIQINGERGPGLLNRFLLRKWVRKMLAELSRDVPSPQSESFHEEVLQEKHCLDSFKKKGRSREGEGRESDKSS